MSKNELLSVLSNLKAFPILGQKSKEYTYFPLDLSVDNRDLKQVDVSSSEQLQTYIWRLLDDHKAQVAYGGYLERRGIYNRSDYFNQSNPNTERNIHLGLDIWIEADTPVFAPLDGLIHSFNNNTNYGDYGPTILLKHNTNNQEFYTLYGHLSLESLTEKYVGQKIEKGQRLGTLGTAEVNGDYAPHLHFQIIKDLQGFIGDYPGVSSRIDIDFYKENCPDPNVLLKLG